MFGPIIAQGELPQKKPTVAQVEYRSETPYDAVEYHELAEAITRDEKRNRSIVNSVDIELQAGRKVLVLTKRVSHYRRLAELLEAQCPDRKIVPLSSDTGRRKRAEQMSALRNDPSSYDAILGTFSLLSTGVDVPSLDTLVVAGDLKSDVLAEQAAGRILRIFEGKDSPLIVDYADMNSFILKNQARERRKFYASAGWL